MLLLSLVYLTTVLICTLMCPTEFTTKKHMLVSILFNYLKLWLKIYYKKHVLIQRIYYSII